MDVDCAKLIRHFSALVSRETADDVANIIDIAATAPAQRRWRQHPNLLFFMEQTPDDLLQWEMWISQFRSEEHTSELQSLMRISYAVFCLKKKQHKTN